MRNDFKYAPGKPGFGTKGTDGSAGPQGLSMYFTDYDPVTQASNINTAIANDYVLWSILETDPLPSGRTYVTGDLFVDSEGKIYEINAETDSFEYKFASLNTAGYFVSAEVSTGIYGYNRYFNSNNSPKYIIDNVYADGMISVYYEVPSDVYNIPPKDFCRIEYSNIDFGGYNPFTLYSSAETNNADAIALVRDIETNTFRLGNLDNNGNIRNVNLTFDVSSLKHTKQNISRFNVNTPDGEILTNYEINANSLFEGVFRTNPGSFRATYGINNVEISWNLSHFTQDPDVVADLYFYQDVSSSSTINISTDASRCRPLVYHNVSQIGGVNITGLNTLSTYKYYMVFTKNGWERRSTTGSSTTSEIPNISILPPSLLAEPSWGHYAEFCVSSNVAWDASIYETYRDWMTDISTDYSFGSDDVSLWIKLEENTNILSRIGTFSVRPTVGTIGIKYGTIKQDGQYIEVTVDVSATSYSCEQDFTGNNYTVEETGVITLDGMETTHTATIDISAYIFHYNGEDNGKYVYYTYLYFYSDGTLVHYKYYPSLTVENGEYKSEYIDNITLTGIKDASILTYKIVLDSDNVYGEPEHGDDFVTNSGIQIMNVTIDGLPLAYPNWDHVGPHHVTIPCY